MRTAGPAGVGVLIHSSPTRTERETGGVALQVLASPQLSEVLWSPGRESEIQSLVRTQTGAPAVLRAHLCSPMEADRVLVLFLTGRAASGEPHKPSVAGVPHGAGWRVSWERFGINKGTQGKGLEPG